MTHPSDDTLNDYIERELSPAEQVRVATHLDACVQCARVVADIQQIVRDASVLGPIAPPPQVWTGIHTKLSSPESGVQSPQFTVESPESIVQRPAHRVDRRWPIADRRWAWAAATAALVIMGFFTGRFVQLREQQRTAEHGASTPSPRAVADAAIVRERVLLIAVGDHLERSQMVLVELAHAKTQGDLDISAERQLADDLVASNRLYRQTAQQMGQTNVAGILDDLERVLMEVARGPSTVSMRQLADIQQRIESQGILFKVKIIGSDIRTPPVS